MFCDGDVGRTMLTFLESLVVLCNFVFLCRVEGSHNNMSEEVQVNNEVKAVHQAAAACYDKMALKHATDHASAETPFRHFNNFVKKSLIQSALDNTHANRVTNASVLDLASGRGGDLMKWVYVQSPKLSKATAKLKRNEITKASAYHCYDISHESIHAAKQRSEESLTSEQANELHCTFSVANCFDEAFLKGELSNHPLYGKFDIITVQFAFHYACSDEDRVRMVLGYCFRALAPGGVFVATVVNSDKVRAMVDLSTGVVHGAKFQIQFRNIDTHPGDAGLLHLGAPYRFFLEDFVDCDEFFVPIEDLRRIASAVGFEDESGKPFDAFIPSYRLDPKSLVLSADDKELTSLYRVVVLRRPGGMSAVSVGDGDAGSRFAAFRR
jgi:mRNA (guanine-N7-)-methyltransferase